MASAFSVLCSRSRRPLSWGLPGRERRSSMPRATHQVTLPPFCGPPVHVVTFSGRRVDEHGMLVVPEDQDLPVVGHLCDEVAICIDGTVARGPLDRLPLDPREHDEESRAVGEKCDVGGADDS